MNKEPYTQLVIDVIEFKMNDVIMYSDPIEEEPEENGGGVLVDP